MGVALFTNNAVGTLAGSITNAVTAVTVASGQGALFPSPSGGDWFYATLYNASQSEIVKCTSRATDTLTVVRGQQGTSALAFSAGDKIELRVTASDLNSVLQPGRNLSELASASTARANLGLGSAAVQSTSFFAQVASNLSDLASAPTARANLGLGTAATQNTGTSGGTVPLLNTSVSWTGTVTATGFIGPLTGNVTGNVSGNAGTATTASAVAAGSVAPAGLTTGHPSWDAGNFYPFGYSTGSVWVEHDPGNGHPRIHFAGSGGANFIELDTTNNRVFFVLNGVTAGHVDAVTAFTNDV